MGKKFKNALFGLGLLSLLVGGFALGAKNKPIRQAAAEGQPESVTISDCYFAGSDYGQAADGTGLSVDNESNHWGKYDWAGNQNVIDLSFNAVVGTAESEFYVYLGNKQDEGGCVFLIQFQASGLMTYAYSNLDKFQNPFRWDSLGFTGAPSEYRIRLQATFDAPNRLCDASIEAVNLTRNAANVKTRTVEDIALGNFDTSYTFVRLYRRGSVHDITLFDAWNTITFIDGQNTSYREVTRHAALGDLPEPLGMSGGVFENWVDENGAVVNKDLLIDRDRVIRAKYAKTYYTVTFDDDGTLSHRDIDIGEPIGELPTPQGKEGYLFEKWVDSSGVEVDGDYIPADDLTIYAKYLPKIGSDRVTLKDLGLDRATNYAYQEAGYVFQDTTNYIGHYDLKENDNAIDLSFEVEADRAVGSAGNQIILRMFENIDSKPGRSGLRIYLRFKPTLNNLFIQLDDTSNPDQAARFLGAYNGDFAFQDKTFYTARVIFGFNEGGDSCHISISVEDRVYVNVDSFVPYETYLEDDIIRFGDCYGNPKVKDSFNTATLIDRINGTEERYHGYYGLANPDIPEEVAAPSDQEGYVFAGWFANEEELNRETPYSGNKSYYAKWLNDFDKKGPTIIDDDLKFETGSFNNFDYDSLISDESGSYEILRFEFSEGCLDEYDRFLEGRHTLTIKAIDIFFNETEAIINIIVANKYTVRFVSEGETLLTLRLYEGELPAYVGEAPSKASDAYNSYSFVGWDKEIVPVSADVDYVARFASTPIDGPRKEKEETILESKEKNGGMIMIIVSASVAGAILIGALAFLVVGKKKKQ